jgi:plasmid stabilization system protein ParE
MTKFSVERSVQFKRDVEEIFVYIAEDDMDAGFRFLDSVEIGANLLADHPMIGSPCDFEISKLKNIRIWPVKRFESYLVFYVAEPDIKRVRLLRLIDSRRDLDAIFAVD